MIEIQVRNFRKIKSADIVVDRVALIQAPNENGKSSIMWAVRAALAQDAMPDIGPLHEKWKKADLDKLVNGEGPAVCNVRGQTTAGADWSATMNWPSGEGKTAGQVPVSSHAALGMFYENLGRMTQDDRGHALHELLRPKATLDDFKIAIEASEKGVAAVYDVVNTAGWDAALERAQEKLGKLKGTWEGITGERFGNVKFQDWRPANWTKELEELTPESVAALVSAAEQMEQESVAGGAVQAEKIAQMTALAETAVDKVLAYENALKEEFNANEQLNLARASRQALPAVGEETLICPHCSKPVALVGTELKKTDKAQLTQDEIKKRRLAIADWDGKISNLDTAHKRAIAKTALASSDADAATKAKTELDALKDKVADSDLIAKARNMVILAKQKQDLVNKVAEANRFANAIKTSLSIVGALKPDGIRTTMMMAALGGLNERLKAISEAFGLPTVRIDDRFHIWSGDMSFTFNGSGSQQHRIMVVLQIAVAELDGSPLIIIDSDTDWDRTWYGKLCRVLLARKMYALVSVRCDNLERAFNTRDPNKTSVEAFRKMVQSYWIQDGVCTRLPEIEKVAA